MGEDTNYENLECRLKSFKQWTFITDPQKLANAGFNATGYHDIVRCFACGLGLRYMRPEDDPLIEHKKHGSPTCHFLSEMSGNNQKEDMDDNVASVLSNDQTGKMDELSDLEEENVRLKERTTCKVCRESPAIVLLLPCSHLAACVQCGPSLSVCPVCEKKIVESVKTFLG